MQLEFRKCFQQQQNCWTKCITSQQDNIARDMPEHPVSLTFFFVFYYSLETFQQHLISSYHNLNSDICEWQK